MKLSIKEREVLFAFGCPSYRNTIARLKMVTTLTVDPDVQTVIQRLAVKLMAENMEKWLRCCSYNLRM